MYLKHNSNTKKPYTGKKRGRKPKNQIAENNYQETTLELS